MEFKPFQKIPRLSRNIIVTEKLDGTNAIIAISDDGDFFVGGRNGWLLPDKDKDNFGFARWAYENRDELMRLGPGYHAGEWWGSGIGRRYNIDEKRFSLFNTSRWSDPEVRPACCHVTPVLYEGIFSEQAILDCLTRLATEGSVAAPGFMKPEGVIVFHVAGNLMFKKTIERDEKPKGSREIS